MEIDAAMRRAAMQVERDGENRDLDKTEEHQGHLPVLGLGQASAQPAEQVGKHAELREGDTTGARL